jgi:uracil-DNA glycosylase
MIWFVGSNPSRKNADKLVPFQGTKSLLNLKAWIVVLGAKNYSFINASEEYDYNGRVKLVGEDYVRLESLLKGEKRVVALGVIASRALSTLKIKHFRLPHPSPRNRLLNNPIFIEKELAKCKEFLAKIK